MDSLIIFGAKYLFLAVVLIWLVVWWQAGRERKWTIIWASAIAVLSAAVVDKLSAKLYYDPRPFVSHHLQPLIAHAADNGFPSEHTLFSASLAAVIFFYRPRLGLLAGAIALLVGICRVAAHVHSPIDIAGGYLFGVAAGYVGYLLTSKFLAKPAAYQSKDPKGTQ